MSPKMYPNPWRDLYPVITSPIRSSVVPRLCATCGRHYGTLPGDARSVMCCGLEAPPVPAMSVAPGTPLYLPNADQFVDAPVVVGPED
jgi:hypothetical protein